MKQCAGRRIKDKENHWAIKKTVGDCKSMCAAQICKAWTWGPGGLLGWFGVKYCSIWTKTLPTTWNKDKNWFSGHVSRDCDDQLNESDKAQPVEPEDYDAYGVLDIKIRDQDSQISNLCLNFHLKFIIILVFDELKDK